MSYKLQLAKRKEKKETYKLSSDEQDKINYTKTYIADLENGRFMYVDWIKDKDEYLKEVKYKLKKGNIDQELLGEMLKFYEESQGESLDEDEIKNLNRLYQES
jgi:uncharacterized protein YdgA (DUF945 family)